MRAASGVLKTASTMLGRLFGKREPPGPGTPSAPSPVAPAEGYGFRTVYEMFPNIDEHRQRAQHPDIDEPFFWEVVEEVKPYTLLTIEGLYGLYEAVQHVAREKVPGDVVECGVFLGGSMLAAMRFAAHFGLTDRRFHLYDTFAGFPEGAAPETDCHGSVTTLVSHPSFIATAREVVGRAPFPPNRFEFVVGDVAQTLRHTVPDAISLLRLDTDDYASTRAELEALYPRLTSGGVLLLDDYGLFRGVRRATEEFLETQQRRPLLHRASLAIRSGTKP